MEQNKHEPEQAWNKKGKLGLKWGRHITLQILTLVDTEPSVCETPGKGDNAAQYICVTQSGYNRYSSADVDESPLANYYRYSVYSSCNRKK